MRRIGLRVPESGIARSMEDCRRIARELGYPLIVRPSFTLGGAGGGAVYNPEDLERIAAHGLDLSMIHEIMLEQSIIGWKEFELEVMRDRKGQCGHCLFHRKCGPDGHPHRRFHHRGPDSDP